MYISLACSNNGMYHGMWSMGHGVWNVLRTRTYSRLLHMFAPRENYGSISGDPMEYSARLVLSSAWLICRIGPFLVWFICNPVEWPNSSGVDSGQLANHGKMQDPWSCFSRGFVNRIGIG